MQHQRHRHFRHRFGSALFAIMSFWLCCPAQAVVINVPGNQPTIQSGINSASTGDTILVAAGTWSGVGNINLDYGGKAITVRGAAGSNTCIIDCGGAGRGVHFHTNEPNAAVFEGFTIRNGLTSQAGAILIANGSPTIRDCAFTSNSSSFNGGAVVIQAGLARVERCRFSVNTATNAGGGLYTDGNAAPTIVACSFTSNSSNAIGGSGGGGAIYSNSFSSPHVINCLFSGNSTATKGGAVYTENGTVEYVNCTFHNNSAVQDAGGLLLTNNGNAVMRNCIAWNNTPNQVKADPGLLVVEYSSVQGGFAGTGNIASDPQFICSAGGNLHLLQSSPCIDAGNNNVLPNGVVTDLDGGKRFSDVLTAPNVGVGSGPIVDMGAYEFQAPCSGDTNQSGTVDVADLLTVISNWGNCP